MDIESLRKKIDETDLKVLELLNYRAKRSSRTSWRGRRYTPFKKRG